MNRNTDKKKVVKLSKKGIIIEHYLEKKREKEKKGMHISYNDIAKEAGVNKSTIYYYNKCRPKVLYEKNKSKLPKKYIDFIYKTAVNKKLKEISGRILAEKVNEKLKKDCVLNKKGEFVSISKSQINRILKKKLGKPSIRTKIKKRKDGPLLELGKKYDEIHYKENNIKGGMKLPKKINKSIEKRNIIDNEWNENKTELNHLLNDYINNENDTKKIDLINISINKSNNIMNLEFKYNSEQEINELLYIIKNFVKLNLLPVVSEKFNISQNPLIISLDDTYTQQKATMDPCPIQNNKQIYHIKGNSNWNSLRIYNNFESFKKQNYEELKLPINGYGTNWTVFKNCLYHCADTSGIKIVKINLNTLKKEVEKNLNNKAGDTGLWGSYNSIIFISNPQSLYIICKSNNNKLVIRELNPDSLNIKESWEIDAKQKNTYGALFMIGKTLFGIDKYNSSPTKIIYKYDLDKKISYNTNINFQNVGGYDSSLHYCYPTKQLWTINNGKFYSYDLDL